MNFFNKFNNFLEKYFVPVANKIAKQRHVEAVKDGVVMTMPLTITGSIFLILAFLPLPGYSELLQKYNIGTYLSYISGACFGIIALIATAGISYSLATSYKMKELSIPIVIITLASYFVTIMPTMENGHLSLGYLGATSLFPGIVISLISVEIIKKIVDRGITIKMPDSVPPAIAKTFISLIPAVATITFWGIVTIILSTTGLKNLHDAVNIIVGTPLKYVGDSLGGQLAVVFTIVLLWTAGIHGASIVGGVMSPIYLENILYNANLAATGVDNIHSNGFKIASEAFKNLTIEIGGSGSTIGLVLLMLFFAKSKQLKEVGKLAITPAIFNINEPVIFGTPIVMNPILMIPFIISPLVATTITWFAMKFDLVKIPFAIVPWTTPPIIGGLLASGFAISVAVITIVNIIVSTLIYYPFFKIYDKQLLEEESKIVENNE